MGDPLPRLGIIDIITGLPGTHNLASACEKFSSSIILRFHPATSLEHNSSAPDALDLACVCKLWHNITKTRQLQRHPAAAKTDT